MYLGRGRTYYRGTEQCAARAPFLIVVTHYEQDGSPLGKRLPLRAFVRKVAMHQCGHFMMGRARVHGKTLILSGTYGSDGLPMSVDRDLYDRATPLPTELEEKFWKGGGWNSAGSEGPDLFQWGQSLIKEKRR